MNNIKIDRLLGITIYLLNHKRTTTQILAERFEVSTRTIIRDINTLGLAGIPITTIYGAEGGYEILETFKMDKQIAGQMDYSYIVVALQGLASAYDSKELNNTLEKMQALSSNKSTNFVLDFGVVHENKNTNELLFIMNQAINQGHTVVFTYTNTENECKEFEVEPVATMYKWYNWYILCYYPQYSDYRIFKLVRIDKIRITENKNSRIHNVIEAKKKWEETEDKRKTIDVKLFCNANIRSKCMEYLNGRIIREYENGDFIYQITVPENEQFWYGMILSFGDFVKVLEPLELIDRIRDNCQKLLQQYKEV